MTDDSGFGVPSTFGGLIPTPSLDPIAAQGPEAVLKSLSHDD